jgi:hypothetical protein
MAYIRNATDEPEKQKENEITEEVIKAGLDELALFDLLDAGEWIVGTVYRAMRRAADVSSGDPGARSL